MDVCVVSLCEAMFVKLKKGFLEVIHTFSFWPVQGSLPF